ncbi:predicted transcriptional regulator [Acidovorax sp. MR-S7]|nr:predicted transcriptional regulator [Acidovorax sp. MR-S7]
MVWRSTIKEHPLNPRTISESARKKLRASVKEIGVMDTPVLNRVTGHLVGGHQRLHTIDFLEKYQQADDGTVKNDYQIEASIVEMTPEQEAKALVRLNNQNLQGAWDGELLAELGKLASFEDMGFERMDLAFIMEGVEGVESFFEDAAPVKEVKGALETIKADRKAMTEEKRVSQSADHYVTVVCKDQAEKEKLMKHLGIPKGELYISPAEIFALRR